MLIKDFNPHIILFTNPFPSVLVSHLKRKNKINTYTATIITDYTAHSVWLDPTIDNYFVGSNIVRQEMVKKGVNPLKIHVTGIPIDEKFNMTMDKKQKMMELGLKDHVATILIMGGGLGLGPMEEILAITDKVNKPLQLIVVAGKNQSLKYELENRTYNPKHKVRIFGFSNNIHELMECSQLLISKAGGLTMTEAVTKRLPILIFDPIPGQEVKNAQYFSYIGVAQYLKDLSSVKTAIEELLYERPYKRERMVKRCSAARRPHAAEDVSRFLLKKIEDMIYKKDPMTR